MSDLMDDDDDGDDVLDQKTDEMQRAAVVALSMAGLVDFEASGSDWYDNSLELRRVGNNVRLTIAQQQAIHAAGFSKVYVNHHDGWETHYTWGRAPFRPARGWRRRYVSDPDAKTTNVIAGPANPGYWEISYWPEGWPEEWRETGYARIVGDPLEVAHD